MQTLTSTDCNAHGSRPAYIYAEVQFPSSASLQRACSIHHPVVQVSVLEYSYPIAVMLNQTATSCQSYNAASLMQQKHVSKGARAAFLYLSHSILLSMFLCQCRVHFVHRLVKAVSCQAECPVLLLFLAAFGRADVELCLAAGSRIAGLLPRARLQHRSSYLVPIATWTPPTDPSSTPDVPPEFTPPDQQPGAACRLLLERVTECLVCTFLRSIL